MYCIAVEVQLRTLLLAFSAAVKYYNLYCILLLCDQCKIMVLTSIICHHSGSERY